MSARRTRSQSAQEWNERVSAYVAFMTSVFESKLDTSPELFGHSMMMMDEYRQVLAAFVKQNVAIPFVIGIFNARYNLTWTLCPKEVPDTFDYAKSLRSLFPRDDFVLSVFEYLADDERLDNRGRFYLSATHANISMESLQEMIETYEIVYDTASDFLDEIERMQTSLSSKNGSKPAGPADSSRAYPSRPVKVKERRRPLRLPTLLQVFPRGYLQGFMESTVASYLELSLRRIECGGGGNCFFYELIASLVYLKTMISSDMFPGYRANESLRRLLDMIPESFEESPLEMKQAISLEMRRMIFNANYESYMFQTEFRDVFVRRITQDPVEIDNYQKAIDYASLYATYRQTLLDLTTWVNSTDLYTLSNILGVSFLICQTTQGISGPQYTWARVRPDVDPFRAPIILMYNESQLHYYQLVYDMQSVFSYESLPPVLRARYDEPGVWPKIEATIVALYE